MIKRAKWSQYGQRGLKVKGITIHNTGTKYSAKELFDYLNESKTNAGCHFLVDANETIQVMPLTWCVYHTGKARDVAFKHTIAVEICNSLEDEQLYMQAQNNAITLIKRLMREYNLTDNNIYFHNDFDNRFYCPHRILDIYKNKKTFIKEALNGNTNNG